MNKVYCNGNAAYNYTSIIFLQFDWYLTLKCLEYENTPTLQCLDSKEASICLYLTLKSLDSKYELKLSRF